MSQNFNSASLAPFDPEQHDALRALNRSPHPYHHQSSELPHPSERFATHDVSRGGGNDGTRPSPTSLLAFLKESSPGSDSGTEADDEHFLKGLPAPKSKLHKGLRDYDEPTSGFATPAPSPAALDDDNIQAIAQKLRPKVGQRKKRWLDVLRRNRALVRRLTEALIPKLDVDTSYDTLHWALSCLPLVWGPALDSSRFDPTYAFLSGEALVLLYPVHQTLCIVLHYLTTTSLLTAELQLLSIALINVLILSASPQAKILKGLLWGGGLAVLVFCGPVIRWGIALARVPKWRFRRLSSSQKHRLWKEFRRLLSWHRIKNDMVRSVCEDSPSETTSSADEEDDIPIFRGPLRVQTLGPNLDIRNTAQSVGTSGVTSSNDISGGISRRHTMPHPDKLRKSAAHTPSGRRKRAISLSLRPYIKLTQGQALVRKWAYAAYVYTAIIGIILVGVRTYVEQFALNGYEPIGWALGYMFGNLPWFRFQVVSANLERWVCLPAISGAKECHSGWVQHLRHDAFGEANTRLILSAYWLTILVFGLVIVFKLKETYEVDTRRKVFHFMMVGMFLPAVYVDPAYAGLALSIILAIFLILDLLRASQLPPLSKPIASFLAPYVDGRDFRGPVVISHIFLLIGCAIPLWLALASLSRTGSGCLSGWEVPSRDVSMVSGVVCVGLGDAAASLIGRRYGHRKWLWGGGKSLEGSLAFAVAVFAGLAAAGVWLRVGGWPMTDEPVGWYVSVRNAGICATMGSLTEAVLTGGNDNVIVPVVLWTCVKSLGI
ncbi:phosphatidate cytidylyltransferase, putative [Metarhizium acridum CQMa 102]|uniref:dolichol kinase n=1 Tax=Metarhizium acridum (strain CQMa 102) TaxID=655827 RepID=E9EGD8_METAQ|nr:phosphatidate cytidylyltransferase, putative [Metarhizium acridum CQMa 102]EFY85004.1 phosphatidate cytidylyltransferase, putative [Metarhizium acridum CQMa 102]